MQIKLKGHIKTARAAPAPATNNRRAAADVVPRTHYVIINLRVISFLIMRKIMRANFHMKLQWHLMHMLQCKRMHFSGALMGKHNPVYWWLDIRISLSCMLMLISIWWILFMAEAIKDFLANFCSLTRLKFLALLLVYRWHLSSFTTREHISHNFPSNFLWSFHSRKSYHIFQEKKWKNKMGKHVNHDQSKQQTIVTIESPLMFKSHQILSMCNFFSRSADLLAFCTWCANKLAAFGIQVRWNQTTNWLVLFC